MTMDLNFPQATRAAANASQLAITTFLLTRGCAENLTTWLSYLNLEGPRLRDHNLRVIGSPNSRVQNVAFSASVHTNGSVETTAAASEGRRPKSNPATYITKYRCGTVRRGSSTPLSFERYVQHRQAGSKETWQSLVVDSPNYLDSQTSRTLSARRRRE